MHICKPKSQKKGIKFASAYRATNLLLKHRSRTAPHLTLRETCSIAELHRFIATLFRRREVQLNNEVKVITHESLIYEQSILVSWKNTIQAK